MSDVSRQINWRRSVYVIVMCALAGHAWAANDEFATVDGERITAQEYRLAVQSGIKKRFYHGTIPEDKLRQFREEVGQQLVDRVLLVKEAARRNVRADARVVEAQLHEYQSRLKKNDKHIVTTEMQAGLRHFLEEENQMQQLERIIKTVTAPEEPVVMAYYRQHPELFTTPERIHASIILLKVDPAAGAAAWNAAQQEAQQIVTRLRKGAGFAELARIHSGDESASKGGDLGFIHAGMLAEPAQQALSKLQSAQISEPVMLLQGVAVLRLEEREAPKLNEFKTVAARARELWQRNRAQTAWREFIEGLRKRADIHINTTLYRET
ncbi:MAG: peptidylprolyl isomerase [Pseudomonadota bacterium]